MKNRLLSRVIQLLSILCMISWPISTFAKYCKKNITNNQNITVCHIDLRQNKLSLWLNNQHKQPYQHFSALQHELAIKGKKLVFAMNAGMYHHDYSPVGWFVNTYQEYRPINTDNNNGNFFLKPNGIFLISNNQAQVIDTQTYLTQPKPLSNIQLATQSGPMLVINNNIHPAFNAASTSKRTRNGVCAPKPWLVTFVISDLPISFYDFAMFFKTTLQCKNALYFDGNISSLFDLDNQRHDNRYPLGPIIGIAIPSTSN